MVRRRCRSAIVLPSGRDTHRSRPRPPANFGREARVVGVPPEQSLRGRSSLGPERPGRPFGWGDHLASMILGELAPGVGLDSLAAALVFQLLLSFLFALLDEQVRTALDVSEHL